MKSIAIIPARGGSKRIERKNIKVFIDKPIIAYSISAAIESGLFDTVMVSTDDEEIAQIAKDHGADVPWRRHSCIASDDATTISVLLDAIQKYNDNDQFFDYGCCIYPCAPMLTSEMLVKSFHLLKNGKADAVIPVVRFSHPPQRGFVKYNDKIVMINPEYELVKSQDLEPVYHDSGQFYWFQVTALTQQRKLFCKNTIPFIVSEYECQDIDTINDWEMAMLKYKLKNGM